MANSPGSIQPMGGFMPQAMLDEPVTIEDRYSWPLGGGVVVDLRFRHADRITAKHIQAFLDYLEVFKEASE